MGAHGPTLVVDHDRSAIDSLRFARDPHASRVAQSCAKTSAWSIYRKSFRATMSRAAVESIHRVDGVCTCQLDLALSNFLWSSAGIKSGSPIRTRLISCRIHAVLVADHCAVAVESALVRCGFGRLSAGSRCAEHHLFCNRHLFRFRAVLKLSCNCASTWMGCTSRSANGWRIHVDRRSSCHAASGDLSDLACVKNGTPEAVRCA